MRFKKTSLVSLAALLAVALLGWASAWRQADSSSLAAPVNASSPVERGPSSPPVQLATEPVGRVAPVPLASPAAPSTRRPSQAAGPVRGCLVDVNTNEPLPEFGLCFRLPGTGGLSSDRVQTDARGNFTSDLSYEAGPLEILPFDQVTRELARTAWVGFEHIPAPAGEAPIFTVRGGPTYKVRIVHPPNAKPGRLGADIAWVEDEDSERTPLSTWQPANLPSDVPVIALSYDSGFDVHLDHRSPDGARALLDLPPAFTRLTPLRGDWVRFRMPLPVVAERVPTRSMRGHWYLRVFDDTGMWRGQVELDSIHGSRHAPLTVQLEPHGELSIRVMDSAGDPLKDVRMRLTPEPLASSAQSERDLPLTGNRNLKGLAPGIYVLATSAPDHFPGEMTVEVVGAEPREVTMILSPVVQGSLSGVIRSESGRFHKRVSMTLVPVDTESEEFRRTQRHTGVGWSQQDGTWLGSFEFEDVPPGQYRLSPIAGSFFECRPSFMTVQAPRRDLVFECLDGGERANLFVRAFDERSGKPLDSFRASVTTRLGQRQVSYMRQFRNRPAITGTELRVADGFPAGHEIAISVDADGYGPVRLELSDFVESSIGPAPARIAEVHLERSPPRASAR